VICHEAPDRNFNMSSAIGQQGSKTVILKDIINYLLTFGGD
jgi:hypothetical protein